VTSAISGLSGVSTTPTTSPTTTPKQGFDQDMFLKLLVAQMQNQDPSSPMNSDQMMSEEATFTQVSELTQLVTAQQNLISAQKLQSASSMVGKTIAYTTSGGVTGTGVVASATLTGSEPTLKVGNTDVPLSSVTEVRS
jgi:flagellar basal-body rod modification protein FlgD